jgi:hypothetical protein
VIRSRILAGSVAIALSLGLIAPAAASASPFVSAAATSGSATLAPEVTATVTATPTAAASATPAAPTPPAPTAPALTALAATPTTPVFDRNDIISDANMLAAGSMSQADIQTFLNGQTGYLKNHRMADHNGYLQYPAEMIHEAAQYYGISPKVILTTLQKEESLISMASPSSTRLNWAMGCGYTDSGPLPGYIGFGRQIWLGTRTLASHRSPWQPGQKVSIDGTTVVPVDASTWSLYSYTPHFGGNKSFWNLWQTYFGDDPAAAPPAIGISASPSSVSLKSQFILFGALTGGVNGDMCIVHVKKPGSGHWAVSSYRLAYGANSTYAYWWYRYAPKLRGTYQFYVSFAGAGTRTAQTSKSIKVVVK